MGSIEKLIGWFVATSLLVVVLVGGLFVYQFHASELSGLPSDWGLFGDYFGGVLGAFFGFLAFIGVLLTVYLQRMQLNELRRQGTLEEFQRLLKSLSDALDAILNGEPRRSTPTERDRLVGQGFTWSVFGILTAVGSSALITTPSERAQPLAQNIYGLGVRTARHDFDLLSIELSQLATCMHRYEQAGGDVAVIDFYKTRYSAVVCWLDATGTTLTQRVRATFDPDRTREALTVS